VLEPHETGAGAGIGVLGYRIALILTGSVALILADYWNWQSVYLAMGGVMFAVLLSTLWIPEPASSNLSPASLKEAVRLPFSDFFQRKGVSKGGMILIFVILYRLGDSMISNMTTPFLLRIGFTQSVIGTIQGGVGLAATILGVLLGGAVLSE